MSGLDRERAGGDAERDAAEAERITAELLAMLPEDVRADLNAGTIDVHDPEFIKGLLDHLRRDPNSTSVGIAKTLQGVQRKLRDLVRAEDPNARVNDTVRRETKRVGRNDRCPCGSGKKYKQCCLRKQR